MKIDTSLQQLIAYYRSCYQLDSSQLELHDYFSAKNSNRLIISSSTILKPNFNSQKINFEWAEEVSKKLRIYEKEIDLYVSSYFLIAKVKILGRIKKSSVPLFFTPIELTFNAPNYKITRLEKATIINPIAVRILQKLHASYTLDRVEGLLLAIWKEHRLQQRAELIQQSFPNVYFETESLRFLSESKLKLALKSKKENYILPVIGLGLLNKPSASRGVLAELKHIALDYKFYPQLIESVFLGTNYNISGETKNTITVPVNLSIPQKNIIKSAYKNNLTLAVGPPGTGKSFTIASIAVDAIVNGKSVLISSKNDQALKVIYDKLGEDFNCKENVVSGSQKYFARNLSSRLRKTTSGTYDDYRYNSLTKEVLNQKKALTKLEKKIEGLKLKIEQKSDAEINLSDLLLSDQTFVNSIKKVFYRWKMASKDSLGEDIAELKYKIDLKNEWTRHLIKIVKQKKIADILREDQKKIAFNKMIDVLASDSGLEKESIFHTIDFQQILKVFPIWLINLKELNEYLPLIDGIFDLVIIDEATQCDIASSIPLLFRGKRAIVVGDPKQLRHVSFLSYKQQDELAKKYDVEQFDSALLDYRNNSILDVVMETLASKKQVHYLDEHYRSMPEIIDFSNQEFYNNSLNIMTFKSHLDLEDNLKIINVNGERDNKGINQKEIDAIFSQIKKTLTTQKGKYSIGIISPFSNQVKQIQKTIGDCFSAGELSNINLLIGTPYHFQGEERDEIHLTFTIDDNTASNVYTYLNKEDVFNVSITRAKKKQYIYTSLSKIPNNSKHLLHRYINTIREHDTKIKEPKKTLDFFLNDVEIWLKTLGFKTLIAHKIAGIEIDLLVDYKGKLYAIDLVGYPGAFQATFPIEKYKTLYRIDVSVLIVSYSNWNENREQCKSNVLKALNK